MKLPPASARWSESRCWVTVPDAELLGDGGGGSAVLHEVQPQVVEVGSAHGVGHQRSGVADLQLGEIVRAEGDFAFAGWEDRLDNARGLPDRVMVARRRPRTGWRRDCGPLRTR